MLSTIFVSFINFARGRTHTHTIITDVLEYNRGNTRKQNCCLVATFRGRDFFEESIKKNKQTW